MKQQRRIDRPRATALAAFLVGLVLGGLSGASTMLLFAPRAGKRTRTQIQKTSAKLQRRAAEGIEEFVTEAGEKTHDLSDTIQHEMGEWQHKAQEFIGAARK